MSDNVLRLVPDRIGEDVDLGVKNVLEEAEEYDLDTVVVIGETKEGEMYVAGSRNAGASLVLIERAKHKLVFGDD